MFSSFRYFDCIVGDLQKHPGIRHNAQLMPSLSPQILEIHKVFLRIFAEADESQIRYAWKQIFHAPCYAFNLAIRQYACGFKLRNARKIFAFRFCEVLSEWIFVETRKKAEKCWRISSISDAVSAEIYRLKPYRLWLSSASIRHHLCTMPNALSF